MFKGASWPEGGTARVRFRAVGRDGESDYLPVRDTSGQTGHGLDLILADKKPSPADLPPDRSPNYLDRKTPTGRDESGKYYLSVGTAPDGTDPTIAETLFTVRDFKEHYFGPAALCVSSTPEYVARYFNKGDLGLGREMHCLWNGARRRPPAT
jgi:hypothetical protein